MALRIATHRTLQRALAQHVQVRGMATEKQIFNQIQSTTNIKKITSSMKMVSAAKLKGAEARLTKAKPFNSYTARICGESKSMEDATFEELPQKTLLVPFTSDKGLCGGINSFITRGIKDAVKKLDAQGKECDIVVIGDKGRSQMGRSVGNLIKRSATEVIAPPNFALCAQLSSEVIAAGAADYDAIMLVHNSFVNPAVYKQVYRIVTPFVGEGEDEPMMEYEFEPDTKSEVTADMFEYVLASQMYFAFIDGATAEEGSRMSAMENASKNAGEMIDSLTLQYNRARQSRITTELIEIISGASALDG